MKTEQSYRHRMRAAFLQRVRQQIDREGLLEKGDGLCCALSGGADSVALLRSMIALKKAYQLNLTAVHVNHHLRGEESERDAMFCQVLCNQYDVPIQIFDCDVTGYQQLHGCSLETAARECRYACFSQISGKLATAHTASDNLETVLHRLIRGCGLHGLSGIPIQRDNIIRPLLFASRTDIEQFLSTYDALYVTDSTNESDDYLRNRIRHHIVPVLREMNPSIERTTAQLCQTLRQEDDYMQQQAAQVYVEHFQSPQTLTNMQMIHPAIRLRCFAMLLSQQGIAYDGRMLYAMDALIDKGGSVQLNADFGCRCSHGSLTLISLQPQKKQSAEIPETERYPLQMGENRLYEGYLLDAWVMNREEMEKTLNIQEIATKYIMDCDKIKGNILLRGRVYGDRMQLAGCDFTAAIKKQIQEKVPVQRRQTLHFLEDEEGTIFAELLGIAERVRPDETTSRWLVVRVRETENNDMGQRVLSE